MRSAIKRVSQVTVATQMSNLSLHSYGGPGHTLFIPIALPEPSMAYTHPYQGPFAIKSLFLV